ncbi:alpha/beta fold hydrolase [Sinosporangium siamense]|uniref:Uncharacterized protein n=1 Tax=Sinosporangium siamense TaxID=1367973 RepID=A0A919RDR1_9ACTN|nr:hypothetical protein [Sinosporangium siamense]GII89981.1 hypothetical protein Ssi02_02120 [Sinosporangium siamense]
MRAEIRAEEFDTAAFRAHNAEKRHLTDSLTSLRRTSATTPLPDIPVTVISADKNRANSMHTTLTESPRRLANSLPQGKHVWAEDSGHMVPRHAPDIVVTELLRMVNFLRARQR